MTTWNLQSPNHGPRGASRMTLNLEAISENGNLSGVLTYTMGMVGEAGGLIVEPAGATYTQQTIAYPVSGAWVASYSQNQPDKKFSVFSLSGNDGAVLPTFIAADGVMTGPGDRPAEIRIKVNTASSQYGTLTQDSLSLFPSAT